ncbi:MAG: hypothetical protein R3A52_22765 [Polyangiales bacterium]
MSLDADALAAWLRATAVVSDDGAVLSWRNPARPGYPYPEAAGLWLGVMSVAGGDPSQRDRVARRLARDVSDDGDVGRGGARYAFDTCVALAGLLAHERAGGAVDPSLPTRMGARAVAMLSRREVVIGDTDAPEGHWSVSYGAHLLKCAAGLLALDARDGGDGGRRAVAVLLDAIAPIAVSGRFPTRAGARESYLHASLYALEGLACASAWGFAGLDRLIDEGAAWVASVQDASGGVRAWHDGEKAWGPLRADATAQAMRLWAMRDRERWASAIAKADGFLARSMGPTGGLRYEPEGADENTWAACFAWQAARCRDAGLDARWVL